MNDKCPKSTLFAPLVTVKLNKREERLMENVHENLIEWYKGDKYALCTFTKSRYTTKIKKLKEQFPGEVEIHKENPDGSMLVKIPLKWVKISYPRQRELTEEEKDALRERLAKIREKRSE